MPNDGLRSVTDKDGHKCGVPGYFFSFQTSPNEWEYEQLDLPHMSTKNLLVVHETKPLSPKTTVYIAMNRTSVFVLICFRKKRAIRQQSLHCVIYCIASRVPSKAAKTDGYQATGYVVLTELGNPTKVSRQLTYTAPSLEGK